MRTRALLTAAVVAAGIAAPLAAQTHVSKCGPSDRIVTAIPDGNGQIFYIDDRGYADAGTVPDQDARDAIADAGGQTPYGRVPALSNTDDFGGVWLYLESGGEPGLQVSVEHVALGPNSNLVAITFKDPCFDTNSTDGHSGTKHSPGEQDLIVF